MCLIVYYGDAVWMLKPEHKYPIHKGTVQSEIGGSSNIGGIKHCRLPQEEKKTAKKINKNSNCLAIYEIDLPIQLN